MTIFGCMLSCVYFTIRLPAKSILSTVKHTPTTTFPRSTVVACSCGAFLQIILFAQDLLERRCLKNLFAYYRIFRKGAGGQITSPLKVKDGHTDHSRRPLVRPLSPSKRGTLTLQNIWVHIRSRRSPDELPRK